MNISGATEKILSKENLKQLIPSKHTSVTFSKDNRKDHKSTFRGILNLRCVPKCVKIPKMTNI
jgi:hypothetical protein